MRVIQVETKDEKNSLLRMLRSSSSSCVGLILSRRMSLAPIASLLSCRSLSDCICRMLRLMRSCRSGRKDSFSDRLSFRAIFIASRESSGMPPSFLYKMIPSLESLSVSSLIMNGRAFSLFSMAPGRPNLTGLVLHKNKGLN